jgi:hypothetical protein
MNAAQAFLREYPGVEAVFTRTQMENGMMPNIKLAKQVILAWHQQISGRHCGHERAKLVLVRQAKHFASTHGSPWSYDTNVPLAMYGSNDASSSRCSAARQLRGLAARAAVSA